MRKSKQRSDLRDFRLSYIHRQAKLHTMLYLHEAVRAPQQTCSQHVPFKPIRRCQ
jgi:hypothetical protein